MTPNPNHLLTLHQINVMEQVLLCKNNKDIAKRLRLSVSGVKYHITNLFSLYKVTNRNGLIFEYHKNIAQELATKDD